MFAARAQTAGWFGASCAALCWDGRFFSLTHLFPCRRARLRRGLLRKHAARDNHRRRAAYALFCRVLNTHTALMRIGRRQPSLRSGSMSTPLHRARPARNAPRKMDRRWTTHYCFLLPLPPRRKCFGWTGRTMSRCFTLPRLPCCCSRFIALLYFSTCTLRRGIGRLATAFTADAHPLPRSCRCINIKTHPWHACP